MHGSKHERSLRIGRYSQQGNVYLVTSVVKDRAPLSVMLRQAASWFKK